MGILDDFQLALYDRLVADLPSNVGVGDWPKAKMTFPHVTIGENPAFGDRDKTGDGRDMRPLFHIWSEYDGWSEANVIADQIIDSLTVPLDLSSFGWGTCGMALQIQPMQHLTEDGGEMRHVVLPLRILVKEVK